MKWLVVLLFIVGCHPRKDEEIFTAMSCNKDGCIKLLTFNDFNDCNDFLNSLVKLHKSIKDVPTKMLLCQNRALWVF